MAFTAAPSHRGSHPFDAKPTRPRAGRYQADRHAQGDRPICFQEPKDDSPPQSFPPVESYTYVVFLMSDKAVSYLDKSKGWEFGVGPSMVIVNEGVAKNLSTTTMKGDAYAFISDQKGLMASLSIEGTKISRIKR